MEDSFMFCWAKEDNVKLKTTFKIQCQEDSCIFLVDPEQVKLCYTHWKWNFWVVAHQTWVTLQIKSIKLHQSRQCAKEEQDCHFFVMNVYDIVIALLLFQIKISYCLVSRLTCRYWSWGDLSGYDSAPSKFPLLSENTPLTKTERKKTP